jgi:hypothetical protein
MAAKERTGNLHDSIASFGAHCVDALRLKQVHNRH